MLSRGRLKTFPLALVFLCAFVITASTASPCGTGDPAYATKYEILKARYLRSDYRLTWFHNGEFVLLHYLGGILRYDFETGDIVHLIPDFDRASLDHETYRFSPSLSSAGDVAYERLTFCDSALMDNDPSCYDSTGDPVVKLMDIGGMNDRDVLFMDAINGDSVDGIVWSLKNTDIAFTAIFRAPNRAVNHWIRRLVVVSKDGSDMTVYDGPYNACGFYSHSEQLVYCQPEWSIDSSRIAVIDSPRTNVSAQRSWRLLTVDVNSGRIVQLMEVEATGISENGSDDLDEALGGALDWSWADGRVYFVKYKRGGNHPDISNAEWTGAIYSINPDSTDLQIIYQADPGVDIDKIEVSPDGSQILFVMGLELNLINANGTNHRLVKHLEGVTQGSWSPDGSEIAVIGRPSIDGFPGNEGLFVIGVDDASVRELLEFSYRRDSDGVFRDREVKKATGVLDFLSGETVIETLESE